MAKKQKRMKLPIPDDWDIISGGWNIAMFCYPDSPKWRGIVRGAFYELTRGRKWDEQTGTITDVQDIARQIMESLSMSCNTELTRIADAIEALNPANETVSLTDILNGITNDPLGTFTKVKPILDTMKTLQDLIPGFETKINPVDLAGLLVDAVSAYNQNRHSQELVHLAQLRLMMDHGATFGTLANTVLNLLPGGTIADALTDTDEYIMLTIDTIIQALVGTSTVAALTQIRDAISNQDLTGLSDIAPIGTELTNLNTNMGKLDELVNVTAKIDLIQQIMTQLAAIDPQDELTTIAASLDGINTSLAPLTNLSQLQYLDNIERAIRASGCGDGAPAEYVPEEWSDQTTYLNYKCRAANYIYDVYEQIIYSWKMNDWAALTQKGISAIVAGLSGWATAAIVASLGVTAAPEALVGIVAGFSVFIIFGEVAFSPDDMYSSLTTNKATIVQGLYDANNASEAENAFANNLTLITDVERTAFKVLLTSHMMNILFDGSLPADYTPAAPVVCSGTSLPIDSCGASSITSVIYLGTPKSLLSGDIISSGTLTSEYAGGSYQVSFKSRQRHRITITAQSGYVTGAITNFAVQDCVGGTMVETLVDVQTLPAVLEGYIFYSMNASQSFSITFTAEAI